MERNDRNFLHAIQHSILVFIVLYPVFCPLGNNKEDEEGGEECNNAYMLINKLEKRH
jgi:hypothetical protein